VVILEFYKTYMMVLLNSSAKLEKLYALEVEQRQDTELGIGTDCQSDTN
jgi:hypothetical protein